MRFKLKFQNILDNPDEGRQVDVQQTKIGLGLGNLLRKSTNKEKANPGNWSDVNKYNFNLNLTTR